MISAADADASFATASGTVRMEGDHSFRFRWPSSYFMADSDLYDRYLDLQTYVGWTSADAALVRKVADHIRKHMPALIADFYDEIERHPETMRVITGGSEQIERLKLSLSKWLNEALECRNDIEYVTHRWNIGLRHAEIGLNPAYTSAALSRLRNGLISIVTQLNQDSPTTTAELIQSLNKLLDLDLAVIQDAYQSEYLKREKKVVHERSEIKFRMLVEAAACMVAILRPDHTIAYFSPYSEELTGYGASEVAGRDFLEVFLPDWAKMDVMTEVEATLAGHPTRAYEAPILRRDGAQRWLVWNAQRLDDFEGGPAVLAVGQDFTEWRDAQERLLRSERLAGIGQMVTGIAHESRNALQRIQSSSEMLELEVEEDAESLRHVRRMQEAQNDLRRLFDEVRGYASPIQLERDVCRLDATWQQAWDSLETALRERDVQLVVEASDLDLTASVDRFRIVQLFRNFFENTLAACSDPVRIEIACCEAELHKHAAIKITIRDNGPGLAPEARQNVFEPFFTTKTKGTGLGMAIARRIVDAHGGEITTASRETAGAEFIVILPRVPVP